MLLNELALMCDKFGVDQSSLNGVDVLLLPENLTRAASVGDLYDTTFSMNLATYLKEAGLNCKTASDLGFRLSVVERLSVEVWLGTIVTLVAAPFAMNLLSNYVSEHWLPRKPIRSETLPDNDSSTIHVELHVKRGDRFTSIRFDGEAGDFLAVLSGMKAAHDESGDGRK